MAKRKTSFTIERDPRLYAPKPPAPMTKRCLGLDLGTRCGVAIADFVPGQPLGKLTMILGIWDLSVGPYDTGPLRHIRLKQFLAVASPDLVMYEEVKYDPPAELIKARGMGPGAIVARVSTAAEFLGGLKTTVSTWCAEHDIPAQGLPITVIKKHATGRGNCDKSAMITACNTRFGTAFDPSKEVYPREGTDNMADAAFVCHIGLTSYSDGF